MKLSSGSSAKIKAPKTSAKELANEVHSNVIDQIMQEDSSIEQGSPEGIDPDVMKAATQEADLTKKYGDTTGTALLSGLAEGVVPGADQIATHLGVDPELLKRAQEQHPIAHGIGEGVGLVGGAVLSGGENIAAKATLGGLAHVGEETIAKAIGENIFKSAAEKTLARKIAEKSIEKSLAGGAVGAGFGVNQLLNENALGEADLTGENLVAYAGSGAILNGLVGGAFGAGEVLSPIAKEAVDSASGQLKKSFGAVTDPRQALAELVSKGKTTSAIVDDLADVTDKELSDHIQNRVKLGIADGRKEIQEKLETAKNEIGTDLDTSYKNVDKLTNGKVAPASETALELQQSLQNYSDKNPNLFDSRAGKNVLKDVQNQVGARFERVNGIESAQDLWQLAKDYSTQAGKALSEEKSSLKEQLFRELNTKTRQVLSDNIERMTADTDLKGAADRIKGLNREYRINSILSKGADAAISEPSFLNYKNAMAGFIGNAVGGGVGGLLAAGTEGLLQSDLKRKFLVLNMAERANRAASKSLTSGLEDFFAKSTKASAQMAQALPKMSLMNSGWAVSEKNKKPKDEQEAFKNFSNNIISMRVNPDKLANKIAYNTMRAGYAAPNATRFAQVTLANATQFLYDKMPKDSSAGQDLFPKDFKPSSLEMAKFQRYVQAVENPYSVVQELKAGTLTHEHVEALQAVYPAIYNEVRQNALGFVQKHQDLSYSKKVQLGTLLNIPTDPSMQPSAVIALQKSFQPQQPESSDGGGGAITSTAKGMQGLDFDSRSKTELQKTAAGDNRQ